MLLDHLEKLRHFNGVVRTGSIRKYSVVNKLSQPAISKHIQILEAVLGQSLLIRTREGISTTFAGRKLFNFTERLLNDCSQVDQDIRKKNLKQFSGELTMGTYQSIAVYFLPRLYRYLRQEQKGLRLNIVTSSSFELVKYLKSGQVDFIISVNPPKSKELLTEVLYEDTFSLYKKVGSKISYSDALIFTISHVAADGKDSLFSKLKELKMSRFISTCGDLEVVKAMLEADLGYGILPEKVAESAVASDKIERVIEAKQVANILKHQVALSYKRHRAGDSSLIWMLRETLAMTKTSYPNPNFNL
ncbi:MAG: LysR family transcriptional regulator [Pseudomonadota bacterium]|nr:LysR family transcriptional regulator [Pseudomonadota bacterium]